MWDDVLDFFKGGWDSIGDTAQSLMSAAPSPSTAWSFIPDNASQLDALSWAPSSYADPTDGLQTRMWSDTGYGMTLAPEDFVAQYAAPAAQESGVWDAIVGAGDKADKFMSSGIGKLALGGGGALLAYLDAQKRNKLLQQAAADQSAFRSAANARAAQYDPAVYKTNLRKAKGRGQWGAGQSAFTDNTIKMPVREGGGYFAEGGYASGGNYFAGGTKGQDDKIPAMLSDGEFVIDAETVSMLGDGNNAAGASALEQMRRNLRAQKRSAPADKIPPKAKKPEQYLKKGKK